MYESWYYVDYPYQKDKNNVYYEWKFLTWAESKTFESLGKAYWKDENNVFYDDKLIDWADSNSFKIIVEWKNIEVYDKIKVTADSEDKNWYYSTGLKIYKRD